MINRSFFKSLIVDDEQHGRDQVAYHLNRHEDLEIIAAVSSVDEALDIVNRDLPDIIFLDIDMPNKTGFDLLKEMNGIKPMPSIVFITAYDQYALQAIRQSALDYILKPIGKDEFDDVLNKFRQKASESNLHQSMNKLLDQLGKSEKLRFNQRGRTIFVDPDEIVYCKADGNYTKIIFDEDKAQIISSNLKQVECLLSRDFKRLGRSLIINQKHIREIDRNHGKIVFNKGDKIVTVKLSQGIIQKY